MKFSDIIGQQAAVAQIKDMVTQDRLAHALLLVGPEGVGQLAMATALAQYVNCLQPKDGDSCGRCANCIKIKKGIHPDIKYILPIISKVEGGKRWLTADFFGGFRDKFFEDPYMSFVEWQRTLGGENKQLMISVHEIRALKQGIYLKAFEAPYKVVIVWRAEKINKEGANAFLKLLEEPPDRTLIILTCSDPTLLLTTINSRVQRIKLSRIEKGDISAYAQNTLGVPAQTADEIAQIAEGSVSQASEFLSESNQEMSQLFAEWLRAIYLGDYQKIQDQIQQLLQESKEYQKLFLELSVRKLRDSLFYHLAIPQLALNTTSEQAFQENFSKVVSAEKIDQMVSLMEDGRVNLSGNANPHMVLTALSLRLVQALHS